MDIMVIIQTMIKLFIMLVLGYILYKVGIFDDHTNKKISSLIVNVTSPLLIISSISSAQSGDKTVVLKLIAIGIAMYAGFVVFGKILTRIIPFPKDDKKIYELCTVFANTGFMGYPVLLSIFDSASVFYCAMLHMAFNLYIYTYGVLTLSNKGNEKFKFDPKVLVTPGLILSVVAMIIFLLNIPIPTLIQDVASTVGGVTSPMSMMMIGSSLATYPIKESISDKWSYIFAPIRLLLIPFVTMLVCKLLNVDPYFANIAIVINAMPAASMVLMFATQYNANKSVATKNIIVTTVLSVITIPIVVATMML